jgi:hypothetical protein
MVPRVIAFVGRSCSEILHLGPPYSKSGLNIKKIDTGEELSAVFDLLEGQKSEAADLHNLRNADKELQ